MKLMILGQLAEEEEKKKNEKRKEKKDPLIRTS